MADVFVSYAREDKVRAEQIVRLLEDYGWDVFWDQETRAGTHWPKVLEDELNAARCLIALWTINSIESRWVRIESYEALQTDKLVPVLLDDVRAPLEFRQTQTFDLIGWKSDREDPRLVHLLTDLTALLTAPLPTGHAPRPAKIVVPSTLQRAIPDSGGPPKKSPEKGASGTVDAGMGTVKVTHWRMAAGLGAAVVAIVAVASMASWIDFTPEPAPRRDGPVEPVAPPSNTPIVAPGGSTTPPIVVDPVKPHQTADVTVPPAPSPTPQPASPQKKRALKCLVIEEKFQQTGQMTASERDFLRSKECQ